MFVWGILCSNHERNISLLVRVGTWVEVTNQGTVLCFASLVKQTMLRCLYYETLCGITQPTSLCGLCGHVERFNHLFDSDFTGVLLPQFRVCFLLSGSTWQGLEMGWGFAVCHPYWGSFFSHTALCAGLVFAGKSTAVLKCCTQVTFMVSESNLDRDGLAEVESACAGHLTACSCVLREIGTHGRRMKLPALLFSISSPVPVIQP